MNMAIVLSDVLRLILEDACEDYHGLYEIIWALNTSHPDVGEDSKRQVAQQALSNLVKRGWVMLYSTAWPPRNFTPLSEDQFEAVINAPSSWGTSTNPPAVSYWFASTPAGEEAYRSRALR